MLTTKQYFRKEGSGYGTGYAEDAYIAGHNRRLHTDRDPRGSRTVSKKSDIALSSATIRNVMSDLEEMGYLEQPHTSAGRIPSEKAYRLYVNSIMHRAMLTESEQRFIQNCYSNTINKVDEIVRQTAWVLSNMTKYTSLVLSPNINAVKLKHIQLVPVTEGKALVVIVTRGYYPRLHD